MIHTGEGLGFALSSTTHLCYSANTKVKRPKNPSRKMDLAALIREEAAILNLLQLLEHLYMKHKKDVVHGHGERTRTRSPRLVVCPDPARRGNV